MADIDMFEGKEVGDVISVFFPNDDGEEYRGRARIAGKEFVEGLGWRYDFIGIGALHQVEFQYCQQSRRDE